MENNEKNSGIELHHKMMKLKQDHEKLKNKIVSKTKIIDEISNEINNDLKKLEELEFEYVKSVEEYNNL